MNKAAATFTLKKEEEKEAEEETTKVCPFCRSEIDIEAIRCPQCTSILESDRGME